MSRGRISVMRPRGDPRSHEMWEGPEVSSPLTNLCLAFPVLSFSMVITTTIGFSSEYNFRTTWEESLSEGLSRTGWPVDMPMRELDRLKTQLTVGRTIPWDEILDSMCIEKLRRTLNMQHSSVL